MERKLAAILSADVQGYSRLMREDEEANRLFIEVLTSRNTLVFVLASVPETPLDERVPVARTKRRTEPAGHVAH